MKHRQKDLPNLRIDRLNSSPKADIHFLEIIITTLKLSIIYDFLSLCILI